MKKIVFVCHGNICRSPMAEFIFKKMVADRGLSSEFLIVSRATSSEEIVGGEGRPVYPQAKAEMAKHGISCEGKTAQQLKREDYHAYDLFVCMDAANLRNMRRILATDEHDEKLRMLMDYTDRPGDVSDPWYSRRFDIAFSDIYEGCAGLLKALL